MTEEQIIEIYFSVENYHKITRKLILKAFDIYKTNVIYGIETETEQEKQEILTWYNLVLDLNEQAIFNPPIKIQYYRN